MPIASSRVSLSRSPPLGNLASSASASPASSTFMSSGGVTSPIITASTLHRSAQGQSQGGGLHQDVAVKSALTSTLTSRLSTTTKESTKHRHNVVNHAPDATSLAPFDYVASLPGKNVRDALLDAINQLVQAPADSLAAVKSIVGMLHNASLMIDDVEDRSTTRRGQPAAHVVFGEDRAINAANYVYMQALAKVMELPHARSTAEAVVAYTEEMLNLHRGQGRDIWWRNDGYAATVDEYEGMVKDKTGGLFRMGVRLLWCCSPSPSGPSGPSGPSPSSEESPSRAAAKDDDAKLTSILSMCDALAVYFQIRDDLINLASPSFHASKGFADDVTEGKLSFPVVVCPASKDKDELMCILKTRTTDEGKKRRAVELLREAGALKATLARVKEVKGEIMAALGKSAGSSTSAIGSGVAKVLGKVLTKLDEEMGDVVV